MTEQWAQSIAKLQQVYEQGNLDEATYRAAVAALMAQQPTGVIVELKNSVCYGE